MRKVNKWTYFKFAEMLWTQKYYEFKNSTKKQPPEMFYQGLD